MNIEKPEVEVKCAMIGIMQQPDWPALITEYQRLMGMVVNVEENEAVALVMVAFRNLVVKGLTISTDVLGDK